jgi:hypothetical protein
MPFSFRHLRDFLQKQMRMSHIYQPVMVRELLTRGGKASIRSIAAAFLARDESQLEYYEQITKNMPGKAQLLPACISPLQCPVWVWARRRGAAQVLNLGEVGKLPRHAGPERIASNL